MRDFDQDRNLQRGDQVHVDCSTSGRISAVSYQQTAKADGAPYRKKVPSKIVSTARQTRMFTSAGSCRAEN